jgi:hypothetical protein
VEAVARGHPPAGVTVCGIPDRPWPVPSPLLSSVSSSPPPPSSSLSWWGAAAVSRVAGACEP